MNLALWLERAGRSYGERPAVGHGTRVVATYGALAERAARLAGALRGRCGLAPGDRVAIAAANAPEYLEMLYGVWHAGLAAVPANAKLHGRELGYILAHSGARVLRLGRPRHGNRAARAGEPRALGPRRQRGVCGAV
jgi:long-chain acyl-CoA synthetase